MIPVKPSLSEIDELPGEEIEFTIGDARWVMRSMADLYSNRELAVVREYSTNARDANIEAGKSDVAIEVSLPTLLNPYFVVRDFGEGMSGDVLRQVYTRFGTSSKRNSNAVNGMLGFGSKSAVAYTNSFTVTSIHNGIKNVAVITRKPDFSIVMKILATSKTTDPSGTEISVPVHNWEEFSTKANHFYKFWPVGTVLVDGEYPEQEVGQLITEGLYASPTFNRSYIVMGNVPYRIDNPAALFSDLKMKFINFVAYVDNGDVEFTPSREDLKYTPHTVNSLKKIIKNFEDKILEQVSKDVDACTNAAEAFKAWRKWSSLLGDALFSGLEFEGNQFDNKIVLPKDTYRYRLYNAYGPALKRIYEYSVTDMEDTLVVKNFDLTVSSRTKQIVKKYIELEELDNVNKVLFTPDDKFDSVWVDNSEFVDWEDVKDALPKPEKKSGGSTRAARLAGSWDYWDATKYYEGLPLDEKDEVYWVTADEARYSHSNRYRFMLAAIDSKAKVVKVYANRLNKFKRDFPNTQHFLDYYKSFIEMDEEKTLTDDDKKFLSVSNTDLSMVSCLDTTKIDDPIFEKIKDLQRSKSSLFKEHEKNLNLLNVGGLHWGKIYHPKDRNFLKVDYPLLYERSWWLSSPPHEHWYLYINAVYNQKKGNK